MLITKQGKEYRCPGSCSCSYTPNRSSNTGPSPLMGNIQKSSCSLPPASHSPTTMNTALSQSAFYSSRDVSSKDSKGDHSATQSQTSLSPLLAPPCANTQAPTSSSSSSKTTFLKALFDRKHKGSKQASRDSINSAGSSSQASSSGSQKPPSATGSSSERKNVPTQQQQPPTSFADLAYRYGSPSFKSPRL
jgi:hypothetical protein